MKELSIEQTAALGKPVLDTRKHTWQVELDGVVVAHFTNAAAAEATLAHFTSAHCVLRSRTGRVLCNGLPVSTEGLVG